MNRARRLLGYTRFNLLPPGDCLARSAREQTVAAGGIPVVLDFPDSTPWAQDPGGSQGLGVQRVLMTVLCFKPPYRDLL